MGALFFIPHGGLWSAYDEGHHIILKGASGNGKTYIACALGNAACRRFKKTEKSA